MRSAKRIIAVCLTATMVFQGFAPTTSAFAQELNAAKSFSLESASGSNAVQIQEGLEQDAVDADGAGSGSGADANQSPSSDTTAGNNEETPDGLSADASASGQGAESNEAPSSDEPTEVPAARADEQTSPAANTGWDFNSLEELDAALKQKGVGSAAKSGDAVTITFDTTLALLMVSNADPKVYQEAVIQKGGTSGASYDLSQKLEGYSFMGFGSDDAPFKGYFSGDYGSIAVAQSFYNNVELSENNKDVRLTWKGSASQPIVGKTITGNGQELNAEITVADTGSKNPQETDAGITSALLGTVKGDISVTANYSFSGTRKGVGVVAASDNAGLLANTVESGTFTVNKVSGLDQLKGEPSISAAADGGCAGGLIGCTAEGVSVAVNSSVDLSAFSIVGKECSGGFIGKATKLNLAFAENATVKPALKVGSADATYAGGAIGRVSFAGEFTVASDMFVFDDTLEIGARRRAGGIFGSLDVTNGDVTVQGGVYKSKLVAGNDGNSGTSSDRGLYGGLVGDVYSTDSSASYKRALQVTKSGNDKVVVEMQRGSGLSYAGGVVGYIGNNGGTDIKSVSSVAVVVDGACVTCKGDAYASGSNGKYGGVVGVLDTDNVLDIRDFELITDDDSEIGKSGGPSAGIAGSACRGILKFSGTTDFSKAKFSDTDYAAQLVWENYNSLIFATGSGSNDEWKYLRSNDGVGIDDIHDYGEVVRLGDRLSNDLIKLDSDTHILTLADALNQTNGEYKISSEDEFAKLAITWQTFGYFSMVSGIKGGDVASLASSTIEISGTIELSGTGLTGLTKDRVPPSGWTGKAGSQSESSHVFSGTLKGSGSVGLAVGEPYGMRNGQAIKLDDASDGNGKIYRHGRLGLFMGTEGATVEGITIGGFMRFDGKNDVSVGALAATCQGSGNTSLSGLSVTTEISYCNSAGNRTENIGGIFGSVFGSGTLLFGSNVSAKATVASNDTEQGNSRVGGAIGYMDGDCSAAVNVEGLTVGGSVSVKDYAKNTLAGGFIGYIEQGSSEKTVNITKLAFDGFDMSIGSASAGGDSQVKKTAGGLLGYSWGGVKVTLGGSSNSEGNYALTATNTSVVANDATEFGGLVYAASGYWTVADYAIDLSGVKFSASTANKFGVLVCRGGSAAKNGTIGVDALTGLYLENTAYWGAAYKVNETPSAMTLSSNLTNFDEWVADACRPGSKLDDWNVNGVVSLHTQAEKLNMSGAGNMGSYENRTDYGKNHQANGLTRYYYNLDRARDVVSGLDRKTNQKGWMSTPEELVLWSATHYAAPDVRNKIVDDSWKLFKYDATKFIGKTSLIDLDGYSFYPVDVSATNITIGNTAFKFWFSEIKNKENANKLNSEQTQHMAMHAGLLRSFSPSSSSDMTVSVSGVTLSGSIGVNAGTGGSGALISGNAKGTAGGIARISISNLQLNGLVVDGASDGDYKPLLINGMPNRASLSVAEISVVEGSYGANAKAASSLFGNLGGNDADMVSASFSKICVPTYKGEALKAGDAIFTHASLLESFGFGQGKTGSASYTFCREDGEASGSGVTYGEEIDSKGEYAGKQLWYYDANLYGTDSGLVSDGSRIASESTPQYGVYLPYVCKGKDGTSFHEIKVNQRVASLEVGCGTYADPYALTSAAEVCAVSEYINNESAALDGWRVSITTNQQETCTRRSDGSRGYEAVYVYSQAGNKWIKDGTSETLENNTMHRYLQSAYYSIEPAGDNTAIELDGNAFNGFGNESNPFRGMIVGDLKGSEKTELVIKNSDGNSPQSLIPYSYGSVIKNLKITYSGSPDEMTYASKNGETGTPSSFFGGVIGCIMGGDNIVDGVTVGADNNFSVSASGDKSYLIPVGGYVGAIAGGGVIFRGMEGESWRSDTKNAGNLYDNPYVGRVIDGYAFSEGCAVDNGDSNYKVNELTNKGDACVETGELHPRDNNGSGLAVSTKVNNNQGLLVLSAIINSGSGAGPTQSDGAYYGSYSGSNAYKGLPEIHSGDNYKLGNGRYGKVRNATYDSVGKATSGNEDLALSRRDDQLTPGVQRSCASNEVKADDDINSPYLVKNYATSLTGYVCAPNISGMALVFDGNASYNMENYGSGYLGLSGRYYLNACYAGEKSTDRDRIVPAVVCVDGNGATISSASVQHREYSDDDYATTGVGILFGSVMYAKSAGQNSISSNDGAVARNLTFENCSVSLL